MSHRVDARVVRIQTRRFLHHKRSDRPTEGKCRSLPLSKDETQKRATTKTGEGDSAPLHTSTPSPRARRRDRPAPRYTRSSSGQRAAHMSYLKANPQQAASHSKSNTRRERITQARTTNQGPGPAPPRRPLHIIQVERPAKEPRHQSEKQTPCTHRNTLGPPSKT